MIVCTPYFGMINLRYGVSGNGDDDGDSDSGDNEIDILSYI